MEILFQHAVSFVALGGTYALLALGLAMIYSVVGLINFAHGELMTVTGYATFLALTAGFPFPVAALLGIAAATLTAIAMERVAFRPVRDAGIATMLLTSFAVSTILQMLFQNFVSARPRAIPFPQWLTGTLALGETNIGVVQVLSIIIVAVLLLGILVFLRKTSLGIAMRAAAMDFSVTRLMGVNANFVIATAFAISGISAGVAGLLWLAQRGSVDPMMGFLPLLKAFIAVVIGGLGSLPGAVLGGFVLAFIETVMRAYLPAGWLPFRDPLSLALVIALLLIMPQGLMGRKEQIR